jgi:hypothetical protein
MDYEARAQAVFNNIDAERTSVGGVKILAAALRECAAQAYEDAAEMADISLPDAYSQPCIDETVEEIKAKAAALRQPISVTQEVEA